MKRGCISPPKNKERRQKGFTLIEIMTVVLIIGTLLNIAAPAFIHARDVGQCRSCIANMHNISLAKEQFAIDNNAAATYTPIWSDLSVYITSGSAAPLCPSTNAVYLLNDINDEPICTYGGPVGLPHVYNPISP
jgi:prepilin-type N-terminal cleavage/methylation domain-containing protein